MQGKQSSRDILSRGPAIARKSQSYDGRDGKFSLYEGTCTQVRTKSPSAGLRMGKGLSYGINPKVEVIEPIPVKRPQVLPSKWIQNQFKPESSRFSAIKRLLDMLFFMRH